jgi:hypothetical protein
LFQSVRGSFEQPLRAILASICLWKRILLVLGTCLVTAYIAAQPSTTSFPLSALTVSTLVPGCNLAPARRVDISRSLPGSGSVAENPWTGNDAGLLASIREIIFGAGPLVDGPPLDGGAFGGYFLRLADGIESGYVAFYDTGNARQVSVYALRFADPGMRPQWRGKSTTDADIVSYFDAGSLAVIVSGPGGACQSRIESHVRTLMATR